MDMPSIGWPAGPVDSGLQLASFARVGYAVDRMAVPEGGDWTVDGTGVDYHGVERTGRLAPSKGRSKGPFV